MIVVQPVDQAREFGGEVDVAVFQELAMRGGKKFVLEFQFQDHLGDFELMRLGGLLEQQQVLRHKVKVGMDARVAEVAGIGIKFEEVMLQSDGVEAVEGLAILAHGHHKIDAEAVLVRAVGPDFAAFFIGTFHHPQIAARNNGIERGVGVEGRIPHTLMHPCATADIAQRVKIAEVAALIRKQAPALQAALRDGSDGLARCLRIRMGLLIGQDIRGKGILTQNDERKEQRKWKQENFHPLKLRTPLRMDC